MFVADVRRTVYDLIYTKSPIPVYQWLPDDVAHLPCYVIGRPSLRESTVSAVLRCELDVTLLGRRVRDDDAQAELDAYADELVTMLGGTRNVRQGDSQLRCTLLLPGTVIVAGNEHPAYIATVATDIVSC